jgi:hypothetical protein
MEGDPTPESEPVVQLTPSAAAFGDGQVPGSTQNTPALTPSPSVVVVELSSFAVERQREEERHKAVWRIAKFWRIRCLLRAVRSYAQLSYATRVQAVVRGFLDRRRIRPFVAERRRLLVTVRYAHQRSVKLYAVPVLHRPNLAARRIQCAWRCHVARRAMEVRRHMSKVLAIMKAFRSSKFRKFVEGAAERSARRVLRTDAATRLQALARGVVVRSWFRMAKPNLEAAVAERRPRQLREQRLAALEHVRLAALQEIEELRIRRLDGEILRQLMTLPASPNRAVLAATHVRPSAGTAAGGDGGAADHGGALKLIPLESLDGVFEDEGQVLLPGPLARATDRPHLPRMVAPAAVRRKAAEDLAAAKVVAQLRREHAGESVAMQYALKRCVDVPPPQCHGAQR